MTRSEYNTIPKNAKTRPIRINGKQVAVLRDDRLLDIRKHSNHFVYLKDEQGVMQRGVCISVEVLRLARHANMIQVVDIEAAVKYTISRQDFDHRSFDFQGSRVSGFGEQRCCFLKSFASDQRERLNYPKHVEAEPLRPKPNAKQLELLGWMK